MPTSYTLCFLVLSLLHIVHAEFDNELTFDVPPGEKMCFYQKFAEEIEMDFFYEVLDGGELDIDVTVDSPSKQIYSKESSNNDDYEFLSSHGTYTFCFDNGFSVMSTKRVTFYMEPSDGDTLAEEAGDDSPTVNTLLETSMEAMHQSHKKIKMHQKAYQVMEGIARREADSLAHKVQMWSVGEAALILLIGFGQVVILRRFFTHPNYQNTQPKKESFLLQST